jgi:hypothetical protein
MQTEFSELTFAYAVMTELTAAGATTGMLAIWPNTRQEARLGYDVQTTFFGVPLFVQFKLSEIVRSGRARGAAVVGLPHCRFPLRRSGQSSQHDLLIGMDVPGNLVLYGAPEFTTDHELISRSAHQTVLLGSAFFSPRQMGPLPDNDQHWIAWLPQRPGISYLLSEPRQVIGVSGAEFWDRLSVLMLAGARELSFRSLALEIAGFLESRGFAGRPLYEIMDGPYPEEALTRVASLYLGCTVGILATT